METKTLGLELEEAKKPQRIQLEKNQIQPRTNSFGKHVKPQEKILQLFNQSKHGLLKNPLIINLHEDPTNLSW
jgi:hypothetical protein